MTQQVPWTAYAAKRLKKGEIPLWNPYQQLGQPLVGNGESAVFYPTMLLHMYLSPTWAWTIAAALKLLIAGAGTWLLARRVGIGGPGRLFSAAAFMLCLFNVGRMGQLESNVTPLLPWAILVTLWLLDRVTPMRMLAASMLFMLQFLGGSPEASLALLLAVAATWIVYALLGFIGGGKDDKTPVKPKAAEPVQTKSPPSPAATAAPDDGTYPVAAAMVTPRHRPPTPLAATPQRPAAPRPSGFAALLKRLASAPALLVAIVVGAACAGVQWVPTLEYLREWGADSFRNLLSADAAISPSRLAEIFLPTFGKSSEISAAWVGTIPLLFAVMAVALAWRSLRALIWTLIAAAIVGAMLFVEPLILRHVPQFPGLDLANGSGLLAALALSLCILAGIRLDEMIGGCEKAGCSRRDVIAGSAMFALLGVLILASPIATKVYWAILPGGLLVALGAVHYWTQSRTSGPQSATLLAAGAIALAVAELLAVGIPLNTGQPMQTIVPENASVAGLEDRMGAGSHFRFMAPEAVLQPDTATLLSATTGARVADLRGAGPLTPPQLRPWLASVGVNPSTSGVMLPAEPANPVLRMLSVRYLLLDQLDAAPGADWRAIDAVPAAASASATTRSSQQSISAAPPPLYELPTALPRAWIVPAARTGPIEPANLRNPSFNPQAAVLLPPGAQKLPDIPFASIINSAAPLSSRAQPAIEWIEDSPERIRIRIKPPVGGWLVIADPIAPGWQATLAATIPGTRQKPEYQIERAVILAPAYGALRAVPLQSPAQFARGARPELDVILEYAPRPWKRGWMTSAAGGIMLLILLGWGLFVPVSRVPRSSGAEFKL